MENKVYFFHYRLSHYHDNYPFREAKWTPGARGGMTVAYKIVGENREAETVDLEIGVAFCSPKDNYCKPTGRWIASKALMLKPLRLTVAAIFDGAGHLSFWDLRLDLVDALEDAPDFRTVVPRKFPFREVA